MSLVVVTGGIGCGKTTLLKEFAEFGCRVADADDLSHEMYQRGSVAWNAMLSRWGESVLSADGEIDRRRVASIAFADSGELAWLNGLIHPLVRERIVQLSRDELLFCAIPLFYEIGWHGVEKAVISTWCDEKTQRERLAARGWSDDEIERRLNSQIHKDEKLKRADFAVITNCSWECLKEQCRRIFDSLR